MQKRWLGRFCTLCVFSVGIGLWLANNVRRDHLAGKAAYLQHRTELFDRSIVLTHPILHALGFIIFIAIIVVTYELVALGMSKMFFRNNS